MTEKQMLKEYQTYSEAVYAGYLQDALDALPLYMITPRPPIPWRTRLRWWCIRWLMFGWFKDWLHKDCDR